MLDRIKGLGEITLRGLVAVNAPQMAKGILNETLTRYVITVSTIVPLVEENKSLWPLFPNSTIMLFKRAITHVGNVDWLTDGWLIDAMRKEHPALASLFLGWRKGRNWLKRQVEEIKKEIE